MKWIAIGIIIVGVLLIVRALRSHAGFEDGAFLFVTLRFIIGLALVVGGIAWLLVLAFMAL